MLGQYEPTPLAIAKKQTARRTKVIGRFDLKMRRELERVSIYSNVLLVV